MDFKEAADALTACPTHAEIAAELGVSVQTVRQARLEPGNANHRPAPARWERAIARLARRRAAELGQLAAQLEKEAE